MKAGELRHRITVQEFANTVDPDTGDRDRQWVDKAALWASIKPLSGREFIAAAASQSKATTRITVRHGVGITHDMRILHRGKIYNIEAVLPDAESGLAHLSLMCSEGASDG